MAHSNAQANIQIEDLKKTIEELKQEIQEYENVEQKIMKIVKENCSECYDLLLPIHYRQEEESEEEEFREDCKQFAEEHLTHNEWIENREKCILEYVEKQFQETNCLCGNNKHKGWLDKVGGDMICEDCDIGGVNQMITEADLP